MKDWTFPTKRKGKREQVWFNFIMRRSDMMTNDQRWPQMILQHAPKTMFGKFQTSISSVGGMKRSEFIRWSLLCLNVVYTLGVPLRVMYSTFLGVSNVCHHTAEDAVVKRCAPDVAMDAPWTPQNKLSKHPKTRWVNYPILRTSRFTILSTYPKVKACLPTATRLGANQRNDYGIESPMIQSQTNMLSQSAVCEVRFLAWDTALWFCSTHDLSEEAGSLPDMASASPSIITNISIQKHRTHQWIASQTLEMGSIGPKCTLKNVFNSRNQAQHRNGSVNDQVCHVKSKISSWLRRRKICNAEPNGMQWPSVVVVGAYLKNRKVQKVMAVHLPEK